MQVAWIMIVALLAILLAIRGHVASSLQTILWDSTKFPQGGFEVEVNLDDAMTIKCPRVDETEGHKAQYNKIHVVPKIGYEECRVDYPGSRALLNCDEPYQETAYVLLIQNYSPIPGDLLFQRGHEYYFISVGDNTQEGLSDLSGGSCVKNHTKLKVKVCCGTASPPSNHKPTTKQEEEDKAGSKEANKDQQSSYSPASTAPITLSCGLLILISHILIGFLV
ncbi:ephrin-B2a-like isoform X2 [Glandiceps talaboti]